MTETQVEIKTKKMLVTPEIAEKWLKKNTRNRFLNPKRVVEIMGWMRNGHWQLTTDSIGFDYNGALINGQHRLTAIVKIGKSFECLVCTGLEPEAFNVIDTVKVRSATDVLGVNDFTSPGLKSAISRFIILYRKGQYNINTLVHGNIKLSNQDILNFADNNKDDLNEAAIIAQRTTRKFRGIETRYVGGLYWIFSGKDKTAAELFFKYFEDGIGLTANDPIFILRQKLIQNMSSNKKVATNERLAWTILAWNYIRSGKKIKVIRWDHTSDFPKPI